MHIKIPKIILAAVILVVVILVLIKSDSQPTSSDPISVGVMLPLSGQYAALGESSYNSMTLALPVGEMTLFFEDTAFDATKALSAYQKLRTVNRADIIVNLDAVSLAAIEPLAKKDGVPIIQIGESNFHGVDNVLQMMPYSYPIFTTLAELADERYDRVAVVYANSDLFITNKDFFLKGLPADQVVHEVKLAPNSDYQTEVAKLRAAKPDAVTVFLPKEDGIKFLLALKHQDRGGSIDIICDANMEITIADYVAAVGADILDGCISTNLPQTATKEFSDDYREAYDSEPQFAADYAYDSVKLIQKLREVDKEDWIKAATKYRFTGASGEVAFDKNGTRLPEVEAHIFMGGKFIPLTK